MINDKNIIQDKSFSFAVSIVGLYKNMIEQNEFVISKQLLRSATSIGANIEEDLYGFSKSDFIFKMSLSLKEAVESRYWLKLLKKSNLIKLDLEKFLLDVNEIINILVKILKTSKESENHF